jgi:hypothetical protein
MSDLVPPQTIEYSINMVRRILLFLALLVPCAFAEDREENAPEPPELQSFPLSLLLEAAETAGGGPLWRPDWPPEIPPDAFRPRGRGGALSAEVSIAPADSPVQTVYRFSRDRQGRVGEFPFLLNRELFQAELSYNQDSLLSAVILKGPEETEPLHLEVLEREASRPSLIRVSWGETYSFVFIQKKPGGIIEAWYDEEGRLFEAYDFTAALQAGGERIVSVKLRGKGGEENYHYDSRGLITGISGSSGDFSVLYYLEDIPLYWDYYPAPSLRDGGKFPGSGAYSLNWDEKTCLLLGLSAKAPEDDAEQVDCRYDYILDEKGSWIERREIRLIRRLGLLVPAPGILIKRVLEYEDEA